MHHATTVGATPVATFVAAIKCSAAKCSVFDRTTGENLGQHGQQRQGHVLLSYDEAVCS